MSLKTRNKVDVTFNMSSLTDIVFLLLIFFIILSTLVNPYGEKVDLPNSDGRTGTSPTVSVTIKKDLTYYIGDKQISHDAVEQELVAQLKGENNPQALLYVDEMVPTGLTINLFAIARKNNIEMVVATEPQ